MSTKNKTQQEWQSELDELKQQNQSLERQNVSLKEENNGFKQKESEQKTVHKHSATFWSDIGDKCAKNDIQYIKTLIDNKAISMNHVDSDGQSLLHYAAQHGAYEIVQLCISLRADLTRKDMSGCWGRTPLEWANEKHHHHIKQLLHFAAMKANTGERIREKADDLNKQNGIFENMMNEMGMYDDTTREFFEDTFLDLMNKILRKKLIFSDDCLCLAWKIEAKRGNVFESELWRNITTVCREIIQSSDKRDWFFMKTCIIPSNLWFESDVNGKYLYYELLRLVKKKSTDLVCDLEEHIGSDGAKNETAWNELISYEMTANKLVKLKPLEGRAIARQDTIPNGLTSQYNKAVLDTNVTNKTFNASSFYDHYVYLSALSLLSQSVDDEFQASIQQIFNITTEFGETIGYIEDDDAKYQEKIKGTPVWYGRGPVKLLERARNKAQNDYMSENYPTAACVLDLNRCSLVFEDIASLLKGIKHFVNKVRSYQSDAIIGIVRVKNGFKEYIKSTQYADIKLNVLIRGESHNIVGEVQFLLKTMETFKKRAHNLYSIQREEEFMQQTVAQVLPLLLDAERQREVMIKLTDIKGLHRWMLFRNKTAHDVLPDLNTLKNVLDSGNMRCLKWILSFKQQVETILVDKDGTSLSEVIRYGYLPTTKQLINIPRVLELCKSDWTQTIVADMFKYCANVKVVEYVLSALNVSADDLIKILRDIKNIWNDMESYNTNSLSILKVMVNKIGDTEFVGIAFPEDKRNVLESAIRFGKMNDIQYLLSIKAIGARYDCKDDSDEIHEATHRILFAAFVHCLDDTVLDDVLNAFGLTKQIIVRYLKYTKQMAFEWNAVKYKDIVTQAIVWHSLNRITQIVRIIGETCFVENVFKRGGSNMNGFDCCVWGDQVDTFKYLMSFCTIKEKCMKDINCLWTMIWMLQNEGNDATMTRCIMSELRLTEDKLREIQSYKYPEPENKDHLNYVDPDTFVLCYEFWKKEISDETIGTLNPNQ